MNHLYSIDLSTRRVQLRHDYSSGDVYGDGLLSPDGKYFYLTVPKNLSSTIKHVLKNNNWQNKNLADVDTGTTVFVVLRDPTQRWISAVTEYFFGYSSLGKNNLKVCTEYDIQNLFTNNIFQQMLFDSIFFDTHTLPQAWFCQNLAIDNTKFFYFNDDTLKLICDRFELTCDKNLKINNSSDSELKSLFGKQLKLLVASNSDYQRLIDINYWCDHQLIDCVKFE